MAPITRLQLDDLRADTSFGETVLNDAEIARNWDRIQEAAPSTMSEAQKFTAVKAKMFEQVLNSAAKLHDYMIGVHSEKLSQVYDHLLDRWKEYKPALELIEGSKSQVRFVTIRPSIRPEQEEPLENGRRQRSNWWPW